MSLDADIQLLARPFRSWTDEVTRDVLRAVAVIEQATRGGSRLRFEEIEGIVPPTQITLPDILTRETAQEVARDAWAGGLVTNDAVFKNVTITGRDLFDNDVWAIQGNGIILSRNGAFLVYDSAGVLRANLAPSLGLTVYDAAGAVRGLFNSGAGLTLYDAAGVGVVQVSTVTGAARFAVAPQVGAAGATKRVLTEDDLGGVGGGGGSWNGGTVTNAITLANASLFVQDSGAVNRIQVAPTGLMTWRNASNVIRAQLAGSGGQLTLYTAAGVASLTLFGDTGSARFTSYPVVNTGSGDKRVLTTDDLGGGGTRDYPITYVSPTAPTSPRTGDFWVELSGRPTSDDPHASLTVSATAPTSPGIGALWVQA